MTAAVTTLVLHLAVAKLLVAAANHPAVAKLLVVVASHPADAKQLLAVTHVLLLPADARFLLAIHAVVTALAEARSEAVVCSASFSNARRIAAVTLDVTQLADVLRPPLAIAATARHQLLHLPLAVT